MSYVANRSTVSLVTAQPKLWPIKCHVYDRADGSSGFTSPSPTRVEKSASPDASVQPPLAAFDSAAQSQSRTMFEGDAASVRDAVVPSFEMIPKSKPLAPLTTS